MQLRGCFTPQLAIFAPCGRGERGECHPDIVGGNGLDTLFDHTGTDSVSGNIGDDSLDVRDGVSGDTANGGPGTDTCAADAGDTPSSC